MACYRRLIILAVMLFLSPSFVEARQSLATTDTWLSSLPQIFQKTVLWCADHEEGNLYDWEYNNPDTSGGGVFYTGSPEEASAVIAVSYTHLRAPRDS